MLLREYFDDFSKGLPETAGTAVYVCANHLQLQQINRFQLKLEQISQFYRRKCLKDYSVRPCGWWIRRNAQNDTFGHQIKFLQFTFCAVKLWQLNRFKKSKEITHLFWSYCCLWHMVYPHDWRLYSILMGSTFSTFWIWVTAQHRNVSATI